MDKWIDRAIEDLSALRKHPDGGAAAWREACVRMAPIRLEGGSVTDRFVGLDAHPSESSAHRSMQELNAERFSELTSEEKANEAFELVTDLGAVARADEQAKRLVKVQARDDEWGKALGLEEDIIIVDEQQQTDTDDELMI